MNFVTWLRENAKSVAEEGGSPLTDAAERACVTLAGMINEEPDNLTGFAQSDGGALLLADYGWWRITFQFAPDGAISHTCVTGPMEKAIPASFAGAVSNSPGELTRTQKERP